MKIIKYNSGEYQTKNGFVIPSENAVFIEIGGFLDNEETVNKWLQEMKLI